MVYPLKNIPPDLWRRFRVRAKKDKLSLRAVILRLIDIYAKSGFNAA
jgi:hypothetical protein